MVQRLLMDGSTFLGGDDLRSLFEENAFFYLLLDCQDEACIAAWAKYSRAWKSLNNTKIIPTFGA